MSTPHNSRTPHDTRDCGDVPRAWYVTRYRYPDGGGEISAVEMPVTPLPRRAVPRSPKSPDQRRAEAARRAAVTVRRRIRYHRHRFFWTFTWPGQGCHDLGRAQLEFARWMNDYGARWFGQQYLWVMELHPKGHGWHVHLTTDRRLPVDAVRLSWHDFLLRRGWPQPRRQDGSPGFVRVHVMRWRRSPRVLAAYMAKYAAKQFDGQALPPGTRRFRAGRECTPIRPCGRYWMHGRDLNRIMGQCLQGLWLLAGQPIDVYSWKYTDIDDWCGPPAWGLTW